MTLYGKLNGSYLTVMVVIAERIAIRDLRDQNHDRSASPDFECARGCLNAGSKELCQV
jgi:hypothetical protein